MAGLRTILGVVTVAMPALAFAQATAVQPGLWETAVTVTSVNMPSAPPMVAKMMDGRTTRIRHCITLEEATRGPQEMLKTNKACTFTRFLLAGGRLSSEMVCKQGGGTMTAATSGTYTPTSFSATGKSVMTGPAAMTMTTTSTGHRIGDCK